MGIDRPVKVHHRRFVAICISLITGSREKQVGISVTEEPEIM